MATSLLSWYPHERQIKDHSFSRDRETMLLMLQKPETALGTVASTEFAVDGDNHVQAEEMSYDNETLAQQVNLALALAASPESAIGVHHCAEVLDDVLKMMLREQQVEALPKTLTEALNDPRPIVVTSADSPFEVVDVNDAWEGLCGFTRQEAQNQRLGNMLSGPETDVDVVREMVVNLQSEHYSHATLTNYTKSGRQFKNHVQLGRLMTDDGKFSEYFVGVLQEIPQSHQSMG
jgi:PAS domain S-box-containing protein